MRLKCMRGEMRKVERKKKREKSDKKAIIFIVIIDVHNYGGFDRAIKMHQIRSVEEIYIINIMVFKWMRTVSGIGNRLDSGSHVGAVLFLSIPI